MEAVFYSLGLSRSNIAHIPGRLQLLLFLSYRSIEKYIRLLYHGSCCKGIALVNFTQENADMNNGRRIIFAVYSKLMIKVSKYVTDTVVVQVAVFGNSLQTTNFSRDTGLCSCWYFAIFSEKMFRKCRWRCSLFFKNAKYRYTVTWNVDILLLYVLPGTGK